MSSRPRGMVTRLYHLLGNDALGRVGIFASFISGCQSKIFSNWTLPHWLYRPQIISIVIVSSSNLLIQQSMYHYSDSLNWMMRGLAWWMNLITSDLASHQANPANIQDTGALWWPLMWKEKWNVGSSSHIHDHMLWHEDWNTATKIHSEVKLVSCCFISLCWSQMEHLFYMSGSLKGKMGWKTDLDFLTGTCLREP